MSLAINEFVVAPTIRERWRAKSDSSTSCLACLPRSHFIDVKILSSIIPVIVSSLAWRFAGQVILACATAFSHRPEGQPR